MWTHDMRERHFNIRIGQLNDELDEYISESKQKYIENLIAENEKYEMEQKLNSYFNYDND